MIERAEQNDEQTSERKREKKVFAFEPYFLRMDELERVTGLRRGAIYERIAAGCFPQGIRLGENERAVVWKYREVLEWAKAQENNRVTIIRKSRKRAAA